MGKKRKYESDSDDEYVSNSPCTDWCFTLNNYTEEDLELWERLFEDVRWGLVTKEIAPTTGTPHLQGRVVFKRGYRFSQLQKQGWAHDWQKTKCKQDCLYMLKKGSVIFLDKKKGQGKRSDLCECVDKAAAGATMMELYQAHPGTMVRYSRGIREAAAALRPPERVGNFALTDFIWTPYEDWSRCLLLCGPPDIGKTEWAAAHFSNPLLVSQLDQLLDYDKDRHDGIIFDDIDFRSTDKVNNRTLQICLTDNSMPRGIPGVRYRTPVIPKGTKKIFTCNTWCLDIEDGAIARRVRQVIAMDRETQLSYL